MGINRSTGIHAVAQRSVICAIFLCFSTFLSAEDLLLEYEVQNNPVGVKDQVYLNIFINIADPTKVSISEPPLPKEIRTLSGPKIDKVAYEGSFRTRIAYRLRGDETGRYIIKPFIVSAGERKVETETIILEVGQYKNRMLYVPLEVEWEFAIDRVYVGQSVPVSLKMLDLVEIPLVDGQEIEPPTGAFFDEARGIGEIESIPAGEKSLYNVPVTSFIFTPSQSGRYFLPAAKVTALGQTAVSPVVRIDVRPLPAQVRASGAVGNFSYSSRLEKQELDSGTIGVLSIRIEGTGNLRYFNMPVPEFGDLVLTDTVEKVDAVPVLQGYEGVRRIDYYFLSDVAGSFPISPPDFLFFNPDTETVETERGTTMYISYSAGSSPAAEKEDIFPFALPSYKSFVSPVRWGAYKKPLNYLWLVPAPLVFIILVVLKRIRVILVSAVFLLFGAGDSPEAVSPELMEALEAYEDGNFFEARDGFSACFIEDQDNAVLSYALALSAYQLEDYGEAMHFARKAVRLDPMSREYRSFMDWLNTKLELDQPVDPAVIIHPDIFFYGMIAFLSAGFLAAAVYLMRQKPLYIVACMLGVLLSAASCGALVQTAVKYGKTAAIVYGAPAEIRKIPNGGANVWLELPEGFSLRLLDSSGDFYLVRTGYGLTGWVEQNDLLLDEM